MKVTDEIIYVGVNDHDIDLFEGQYIVPNGMAYNSYVIRDEKIAVMDTVDEAFGEEWLENVKNALDGAKPEYLIIQHMEPDHSANSWQSGIRKTAFQSETPDPDVLSLQPFSLLSEDQYKAMERTDPIRHRERSHPA